MICPFCHAEAIPTLSQHAPHCEARAAALLLDKPLPNRTIGNAPKRTQPPRHIETVRSAGGKKAERAGVKCAVNGCPRWRIEGKSYCRECHARLCRESRERKKAGKPRLPIRKDCATGCGAARAEHDTYCRQCRAAINKRNRALRVAKRKAAAAPVDYGAVTWRGEGRRDLAEIKKRPGG
jgi:hypothetical protein